MTLKTIRESQSLSQNQLAQKAGVPVSVITKIEQGISDIKRVPAQTVSLLAAALNVPETLLLRDENDDEFDYLDGRLLVDDCAYAPNSNSYVLIQIQGNWYIKPLFGHAPLKPWQEYGGKVSDEWRRAGNSEYLIYGLCPRGGFTLHKGRAVTPEEETDLMRRYPDYSEPHEVTRGAAFGKHSQYTITVRTFHVPSTEAITIEDELRSIGVNAANTNDGTLEVRVG